MEPKTITMTQEELEKNIRERMEVEIRNLGLDNPQLKTGIHSEKKDEVLEGREKMAKFVAALIRSDAEQVKALSEGTDADGGFLVPTEFSTRIIAKLSEVSKIRKYATVFPMKRDKLSVGADGNAVTGAWDGESVEATESNPTFGNVLLNSNRYTILSKMSRQLLEDASVSVVDLIERAFVNAFAKEENKVFMVGTGTTQPTGIRTYTLTSIAQAGANLAATDIESLYFTLAQGYRENACWLMHGTRIILANNLRATGGEKLYSEIVDKGTLLGRPIIENSNIPTNLGPGTDESEIYFGDLTKYIIGDREQIGIETTTVGAGAFEKHQAIVKSWERVDGQLGLNEAIVKMTAVK